MTTAPANTPEGDPTDPAPGAAQWSPRALWQAIYARWQREVVAPIDHRALVDKVAAEGYWSARYAFMCVMSCGIAILGLLLGSPAVVIGAMLISPLMGPIMAFGFSLALLDFEEMRRALVALAIGTVVSVAVSACIVFFSPLTAATPEILARTRPNFFDLLVAIFSALAGGYAVIRGRGETIVGVAIATALMPPLAVVGYGAATMNWLIFSGSLGLFMTNLLAIALTVTLMARVYGFGAYLTPRHSMWQNLVILVVFILMSVPLAISLRNIAWEAVATAQIRNALDRYFEDTDSKISDLNLTFPSSELVRARAVVLTRHYKPNAERELPALLAGAAGRAVQLDLDQVVVDVDESLKERERAELQAADQLIARQREREIAQQAQVDAIARQVALITGAEPNEVIIDRAAKTARVTARGPLRLNLGAMRALEARVSGINDGWTVQILPPLVELPVIAFAPESAELTDSARATIEDCLWALTRWSVDRVEVIGNAATNRDGSGEANVRALADERAKVVGDVLAEAGLQVTLTNAYRGTDQRNGERELGNAAYRSVRLLPRAPQAR